MACLEQTLIGSSRSDRSLPYYRKWMKSLLAFSLSRNYLPFPWNAPHSTGFFFFACLVVAPVPRIKVCILVLMRHEETRGRSPKREGTPGRAAVPGGAPTYWVPGNRGQPAATSSLGQGPRPAPAPPCWRQHASSGPSGSCFQPFGVQRRQMRRQARDKRDGNF